MKTALVAGATGLVGGILLDMLLQDPLYERVITVTRRHDGRNDQKLVNLVVDFQKLDKHADALKADDIFCCLGTTIKKAGTKGKFREVDHDYPLKLAQLTQANGAHQYLLVSALGADKASAFFYNRVKGEVEEAIGGTGFQCYHIFRPSLLTGPRKESRMGEEMAKVIFRMFGSLFIGPLKKYKAIEARQVAKAMQVIAHQHIPGKHIHESKELQTY